MSVRDPLTCVPVRHLTPDGFTLITFRDFPNAAAKAAHLAELAALDATHPAVVGVAFWCGSVAEAHRYVRDAVRYLDEPEEKLESPAFVLDERAADCDGQAALLAALVIALGGAAELVPMGGTADDPRHLAVRVRADRPAGVPPVVAAPWEPLGLEAPAGWTWAETTVAADFGEVPSVAAVRLGASRADLV